MKNFKQPGETLTLVAPYNRSAGQGALVGGIFGVAVTDVTSGDEAAFDVEGVFSLPKATGAVSQGDPIYWNDTTKVVSTVDSVGPLIGSATADALSGDATCDVRLNEGALGMAQAYADVNYVRPFYKAASTAQVNAGVEIVAAVPGYKIQVLDAWAIAVGGNAATVTTVDLLGTQSASGAKLVAWAQANLTRSAMVRAGATGGTLLADGASFAACDEETALTLGKTGSDLATATGITVGGYYRLVAA